MGSNSKLDGKEKEPLTLVGLQDERILEILAMRPGQDGIYIECKILGMMLYTVCLKSEEMGKLIGLINLPMVWYMLRSALRKGTIKAIIRKLSFWRK